MAPLSHGCARTESVAWPGLTYLSRAEPSSLAQRLARPGSYRWPVAARPASSTVHRGRRLISPILMGRILSETPLLSATGRCGGGQSFVRQCGAVPRAPGVRTVAPRSPARTWIEVPFEILNSCPDSESWTRPPPVSVRCEPPRCAPLPPLKPRQPEQQQPQHATHCSGVVGCSRGRVL